MKNVYLSQKKIDDIFESLILFKKISYKCSNLILLILCLEN